MMAKIVGSDAALAGVGRPGVEMLGGRGYMGRQPGRHQIMRELPDAPDRRGGE